MFVCICRGITDHQIKEAVCKGARCARDVAEFVGKPIQCGKCIPLTKEIIEQTCSTLSPPETSSVC